MNLEHLTAAEEWKRGWKLVLACFVGFAFSSVITTSTGVFMEPIGQEFGWSRTLLSTGVAISAVTTAVLSPFFGVLIDRYGSRRIAIAGAVASAGAISAFGLVNGSAAQWVLLWVAYAVVALSIKPTVWTAAVAGSFNAAQGLAIGLTLAGTAAASTIVPPLANWLITQVGWRMAYVWLGFGGGGITLLFCYAFLHDAHSHRASAQPDLQGRKQIRPDLPGLSIAEAWKNRGLWQIAGSTFIVMLLTIGLTIHQIPILTGVGVSRADAAWLASLAGVAGITGKLVTGVLLDRYRANWVGGLTLIFSMLAFALLIDGVRSSALIVVGMVVNGYTAGSKLQIASYLTVQFAGMKNFGKIYGLMTSVVALGSGLGPVIAGMVYDMSGNYTAFLIAGAVGCCFCGILLITLPRYPDWRSRGAQNARPVPAAPYGAI